MRRIIAKCLFVVADSLTAAFSMPLIQLAFYIYPDSSVSKIAIFLQSGKKKIRFVPLLQIRGDDPPYDKLCKMGVSIPIENWNSIVTEINSQLIWEPK